MGIAGQLSVPLHSRVVDLDRPDHYNDRFETDSLENRVFTFLLMLPVSGLAIFGHHMPGDYSLGYGLCYMAARLMIVTLWSRAAVLMKNGSGLWEKF